MNEHLHVIMYLIEEVGITIEDLYAYDKYALRACFENDDYDTMEYIEKKFNIKFENMFTKLRGPWIYIIHNNIMMNHLAKKISNLCTI